MVNQLQYGNRELMSFGGNFNLGKMLLKKLIKTGICFAIMKSYSSLKKSSGHRNVEYEILAFMEDFQELEEYGFETNQNTSECPVNWLNPDGIISKILNSEEIVDFQNLKNNFIEVYNHPKNGIVYELRKKSFRDIYLKKTTI